jgi:type I restriction enzyme S subunit
VESDTQHRKIGSTEWIPIFPDNEKVDSNFLYYVEWSKYVMPIAKTLVTGSTPSRQRVPPASFYEIEIPLPTLHEQRAIASVLSAVHEAKEKTEAVITATKELKKSLMKHLFTYGPASLEEAENVPLKETEIGMVPEEWDVVMLENVVKKTEQKDPRKTPECQFKYIDVSSINREDLKIVEYKLYKGKDAPSRAKKLVKNSDVIFATVRPTLRRFTLIEEDFNGEICSTAFCVLRAKESFLSSLYVLYVVQRDIFIDELRKIQRGASYPAVTDSDVKNQKIPLPPPSIQQKITSILSAVDEKIEKEETKKKSMEELFKTLLHNLMTGKLRVNHLEV